MGGVAGFAAACLLCAVGPTASAAQARERSITQYAIETWDRRSGLPINSVGALAQGARGYIWIGTGEGLVRFDGVRFRTFHRGSSPAFRTSDVNVLLQGRSGALWIGTLGGGLLRYADGAFSAVTDPATTGNAAALYEDDRGDLWIGTSDGLMRLSEGRLIAYTAEHGLPQSDVVALAGGAGGVVWAGTEAGEIFRVREGHAERIASEHQLSGVGITFLSEDPDGALWIGTRTGLFGFRRGVLTRYTDEARLAQAYISAIHRDRQGSLWVATRGHGLFRLSSSGRWEVRDVASGLPSNDISEIIEDADGNIWLGTSDAGVAVLRAGPFLPVTPQHGLSGDIALPILQDRTGAVWIGTYGQGLNRLENGSITVLTAEDGLADDFVLSLAEAPDGALWVGTRAGLSRLHEGRFTTYDAGDGLPSAAVLALYTDRAGRLWAGTASGAAWLERGRFRPLTTRHGLSGGRVTALLQSRDGAHWFGTSEGLNRLHDGELTVYTTADGLPSGSALALHEDTAGALWIGTNAGLVRMRGGRFRTIGVQHGMLQDEVYCVLPDSRGGYWFSGTRGVWRVRETELNAVADGRAATVRSAVYGEADGLPDAETNGGIQPACWKDRAGRLWFPTMGGAAVVDPARLRERATPIHVLIERVVADGTELPAGAARLRVPAGTDHIDVEYTALSFAAPASIEFQYRLEGFDRDWIHAGTDRTASYTNLRPGEYTLHVRARGRESDWGAAVQLPLRMAPLVYQMRTVQLALLLLLLGLIAAADRVRVRRHRARERDLMALVQQRTQAEERYRSLFENARDIVLTTDEQGCLLSLNRRGREVFGRTGHDPIGDGVEELVAPEHRSLVRAWTAGELPQPGAQELVLIDAEGRRIPAEVTVQRIHESGRAAGIQAIVRDVSERAKLEEQLRHSQKMEAVGRLAGGVAHDFNNLLTVVHGHTQLLLEEAGAADPIRGELREIQSSVERATALTRQLLAFSRRQLIQPRVLDLNQVVRDVLQLLTRLIRADIQLKLELDPSIGSVRVDPTQLEQVLINLVVNARDSMPGGGTVIIRTAALEIDAGNAAWRDAAGSGRFARLSVVDSGVGMDAETQARIFEPFFTTKPTGEGTGLGLATVHGIVTQSGGLLRVESEPGRGTAFHVYLPVVDAEPDPQPVPAAAPTSREATGAWTLLLVEDDPAVRRLALRVLERAGYTVVQARHGEEAIELASGYAGRIHLLLTDLVMPNLNGQEVARRLTAMRPDLRVLFMSGYAPEDVVDRDELAAPGASFIEKPFTPDTLLSAVQVALGRAAASGASA